MLTMMIGQRVLNEHLGGSSLVGLVQQASERTEFLNRVAGAARALHNQADTNVVLGLLALEKGAIADAESSFRKALSYWKDARTAASGGGLEFRSRVIAQSYLDWIEQAAAKK
jgi:uncharacterized protein HemY